MPSGSRAQSENYEMVITLKGGSEVALPITEDEWCKIIKNASGSIKRMLQCYLQAGRGQRYTLAQMEDMFGVKADSLTGALVALGRRAQNMLNFAVIDELLAHVYK